MYVCIYIYIYIIHMYMYVYIMRLHPYSELRIDSRNNMLFKSGLRLRPHTLRVDTRQRGVQSEGGVVDGGNVI